MLSTMRRRLPTISLRLLASVPISSSESIFRLSVRSPLATAEPTSTMCCTGSNQRPIRYQPPRAPRADEGEAQERGLEEAAALLLAFISDLLIATSTPPFWSSFGLGPAPRGEARARPPCRRPPPEPWSRGRGRGSRARPRSVSAFDLARARAAGVAGRSLMDGALLGQDRALRVADHRPHHVGALGRAPSPSRPRGTG